MRHHVMHHDGMGRHAMHELREYEQAHAEVERTTGRVVLALLGVLAVVAFAYNARDLVRWIELERM